MTSTSGKRCSLSIEHKLEILEALKSKKPHDVAKDFNIGYSTVRKVKRDEGEIRELALNNNNLNRKRKRRSPNEEIGEALIAWVHQMRAQNAVINGPLMLEMAKQLSIPLGYKDFKPSHGWMERLKSRHNIKFAKVERATAAADKSTPEFNEAIQKESFEAFINRDKEAENLGTLTDADICNSVKPNPQGIKHFGEGDEEKAKIVNEPKPRVSHKDALMHLSMIHRYLEENFTEYNSYYDVEDMIKKNALTNCTQSKITDFFK